MADPALATQAIEAPLAAIGPAPAEPSPNPAQGAFSNAVAAAPYVVDLFAQAFALGVDLSDIAPASGDGPAEEDEETPAAPTAVGLFLQDFWGWRAAAR